MVTLSPDTTLGAVVNADPSLARLLETRGLDYCCGGERTLSAAAAEAGIDVDALLTDLDAARADDTPPPAWTELDAAALTDHIEATHHRYLWDEFEPLTALMTKVLGVHGDRHPELAAVASCVAAVRADLEPHLTREEQVLFPMIRTLAAADEAPSFHCGSLSNPISVMLREHDEVGELLAQLRQLTGEYTPPADACVSSTRLYDRLATLEADTHLHVHKENNLLFPMVVELEGQFADA